MLAHLVVLNYSQNSVLMMTQKQLKLCFDNIQVLVCRINSTKSLIIFTNAEKLLFKALLQLLLSGVR